MRIELTIILNIKLHTKHTNRGKITRLFITGDYEFLCRLFGISGASGKLCMCVTTIFKYENTLTGHHCCLWCHIRQDQLKSEITPALLASSNFRTLDTIINDHNRFVANGGDHKKVKDYNNALYEPFFDIPLDQVHVTIQATRQVEFTMLSYRFPCLACIFHWVFSFAFSNCWKTPGLGIGTTFQSS